MIQCKKVTSINQLLQHATWKSNDLIDGSFKTFVPEVAIENKTQRVVTVVVSFKKSKFFSNVYALVTVSMCGLDLVGQILTHF